MKPVLIFVVFLCLRQFDCLADEHYQSTSYGIDLKLDQDWKIVSSAKEEVDLHSLTDDQLKNLLRRGEFKVLEIRKGDAKAPEVGFDPTPRVTVEILNLSRSKFPTAMDYAESYKRGALSRNELIEREPEACTLGDVSAASLAITRTVKNVTFTTYEYFVRRPRSVVKITGFLPNPADKTLVDDLNRTIKNMLVTGDADKPSM
jgi:hypothetical protein